MFGTVARYGVRHFGGLTKSVAVALLRGEGVRGPAIKEFEEKFAAYHRMSDAAAASCGRMAFYYILRALNLPQQSEIVFPALTFWVVPEIARVAGLTPVFADVDPGTYNLDPRSLESVLTDRTRVIVPTHLYGRPCRMDAILEVASRKNLLVIEDCAHTIGARYRGRLVGTFGDAAFFSFQLLKGLNTYGGGMALTDNKILAGRIRKMVEAEPWPSLSNVLFRFLAGDLQRAFVSRHGFTLSLFPLFWLASLLGSSDPSRFLWEKIRLLDPLPQSYRRRYSNAQAVVGLKMLDRIDSLNAQTRENADFLSEQLQGVRAVSLPSVEPETSPVYYQYCVRASAPKSLSRRAIRRGIDMESMHVDVCSKLALFHTSARHCPGAESARATLQLPVYSGLRRSDLDRIATVVREACSDLPLLAVCTPAATCLPVSPDETYETSQSTRSI